MWPFRLPDTPLARDGSPPLCTVVAARPIGPDRTAPAGPRVSGATSARAGAPALVAPCNRPRPGRPRLRWGETRAALAAADLHSPPGSRLDWLPDRKRARRPARPRPAPAIHHPPGVLGPGPSPVTAFGQTAGDPPSTARCPWPSTATTCTMVRTTSPGGPRHTCTQCGETCGKAPVQPRTGAVGHGIGVAGRHPVGPRAGPCRNGADQQLHRPRADRTLLNGHRAG